MKVLMISEYFEPYAQGGGEISAFMLAKELAKKNIEVHVLTSYFKNLKKVETIAGVKILRLLSTGSPNSIMGNIKRILNFEKSINEQLPNLHSKEKYNVIHCMNTDSISAIKLKNKINVKFIMHVNGPTPFCPKRTLMFKDKVICDKKCTKSVFLDCFLHSNSVGKIRLRFFTKFTLLLPILLRHKYEKLNFCLKQFDYYMPISTYMQNKLIFSGISKNKTKVVYNILDFDEFSKLKDPKNKIKKILYLGAYSTPKGPQILLDALKTVKNNYSVNFYGSGELKNIMLKDIKKHNLNVKINNSVPYNKIPSIIEKHDILVFPSLVGEAFGRVALEALAAKKTVIASNIGGIPDVIQHNKTGYLFEPGNSKELSQLIDKSILVKKQVKPDLGKFDKEKIVKEVIKIYNKK